MLSRSTSVNDGSPAASRQPPAASRQGQSLVPGGRVGHSGGAQTLDLGTSYFSLARSEPFAFSFWEKRTLESPHRDVDLEFAFVGLGIELEGDVGG